VIIAPPCKQSVAARLKFDGSVVILEQVSVRAWLNEYFGLTAPRARSSNLSVDRPSDNQSRTYRSQMASRGFGSLDHCLLSSGVFAICDRETKGKHHVGSDRQNSDA
jgi:hypothetical protein